MPEKSYVTLEQRACKVCGCAYDTESLLIDTRLRDRFEMNTLTGWGLCPEHQKLFDDGYLAIVAVDETKSSRNENGEITPVGAWRLGEIAHLRQEMAEKVFSAPMRDKNGNRHELVFCELSVIEYLKSIQTKSDSEES